MAITQDKIKSIEQEANDLKEETTREDSAEEGNKRQKLGLSWQISG